MLHLKLRRRLFQHIEVRAYSGWRIAGRIRRLHYDAVRNRRRPWDRVVNEDPGLTTANAAVPALQRPGGLEPVTCADAPHTTNSVAAVVITNTRTIDRANIERSFLVVKR